jgi:hypothetical protein
MGNIIMGQAHSPQARNGRPDQGRPSDCHEASDEQNDSTTALRAQHLHNRYNLPLVRAATMAALVYGGRNG